MGEQDIVMKLLEMLVDNTRQQATQQAQIIAMQQQYERHQREEDLHHAAVKTALKELADKQEKATDAFSQVKGGWKVLAFMGSIAGVCSVAVSYAWNHLFHAQPPSVPIHLPPIP